MFLKVFKENHLQGDRKRFLSLFQNALGSLTVTMFALVLLQEKQLNNSSFWSAEPRSGKSGKAQLTSITCTSQGWSES